MKKRSGFTLIELLVVIAIIGLLLAIILPLVGCEPEEPSATTGVKKARAKVTVQSDGLTVEQQNVRKRLEQDNMPGAIKHLYIISAYSGQTIIYSTVKGKVTSSGKRLSPTTVACTDGQEIGEKHMGFKVDFGNTIKRTGEVLQDDGTYGSSIHYLYWWDSKGLYHQHYVSGGQIIHVSDQPLSVKSVIINMEVAN